MIRRSPEVQANAIRQKRQEHAGSFLIVEGRDDRLFFEHFVDDAACSITVADGKQNVIDVISILEADQFPGIIGVVDADLDHIEGYPYSSDNLIVLETVDLEALLIQSSALDRILVELGSREKLSQFDGDVRGVLVMAAVWIGCLRLHSKRAGLSLTFWGLKYAKCINDKSLSIDIEALVREVMNRSQRPDLSHVDIAAELRSMHGSIENSWLICSGKDMIEVLSYGLRKVLSTKNAKEVDPKIIAQSLRIAFNWDDMNRSVLSQNLRAWAEQNPSYWVLNPANHPDIPVLFLGTLSSPVLFL